MESKSTQRSAGPGHPHKWPEAIRQELRTADPFPFILVMFGFLLPLAVGLLILGGLSLLVQNNSQRPFVYWSDREELTWTSADRRATQLVGNQAAAVLPGLVQNALADELRLLGGATWNPQGSRLAVTAWNNDGLQVAIFNDLASAPQIIESQFEEKLIAAPFGGWSPDGNGLALLEHDPARPLLTVVDLARGQAAPYAFTMDLRAGISWSADGRNLLATASISETVGLTPTLVIAMRDSLDPLPLLPDDGLSARFDGVFAPAGAQIAYAGVQTYTLNAPLLGSLWLTDPNDGAARQLVAGEHNGAPLWTPDGRAVLYTHRNPTTGAYELRLIDVQSQTDRLVGPGYRLMLLFPFDRQRFLSRSPDGRYLAFIGEIDGRLLLHVADANGENVQSSGAFCGRSPATLTWMPTSRAVLFSCGSDNTLYWVDETRDPIRYPSGALPVWKP